jgi:protein involved in polysaccharide export with SLBB domain
MNAPWRQKRQDWGSPKAGAGLLGHSGRKTRLFYMIKPSVILILAVCISSAAQTNTNSMAAISRGTSMAVLDDRQKLGPGDRVTYRVIEDQDEPRPITITDSGDLQVPYLGLVHAAGKTSRELAGEIKVLLEKNLYYHATVIVALEWTDKKRVIGKFYVSGQVRNSGGFEIPAGEMITVSRAILSAGGFSDFSDKKSVRLIRQTPTGKQVFTINVADIFDKGRVDLDRPVQPNDLIVVPPRLVNF